MKLDEENRCAVKFKKRFQTPEKFNNSIVTCLDWSHHVINSIFSNKLTRLID